MQLQWKCPCSKCREPFEKGNVPQCDCEFDYMAGWGLGMCFRCGRCRFHCTCDDLLEFKDSEEGKTIFGMKGILKEMKTPFDKEPKQ